MTYKKAIQVLKQYNAWRKGSDANMTNPVELTKAINVIVDASIDNPGILFDAQVNNLKARIKSMKERIIELEDTVIRQNEEVVRLRGSAKP